MRKEKLDKLDNEKLRLLKKRKKPENRERDSLRKGSNEKVLQQIDTERKGEVEGRDSGRKRAKDQDVLGRIYKSDE